MTSHVCMHTGRQLLVHAVPSNQVLSVTKAYKAGGVLVLLGVDGRLYCPRLKDNAFYGLGEWPFLKPMLTGLVKLGVITQEQCDAELAARIQREEADARQYDAQQILKLSIKHAIELSDQQMATLKSMIGEEDVHES